MYLYYPTTFLNNKTKTLSERRFVWKLQDAGDTHPTRQQNTKAPCNHIL